MPSGFEAGITGICPALEIEFIYYSEAQSKVAEYFKLPFVYSWLSWSIALSRTTTEHVLIHDYDALILGKTLEIRYNEFVKSESMIQGISWYSGNGVTQNDRLVTTFEAFVCSNWIRSLPPISLFNKLRIKNGRTIDFDTTLDVQDRYVPINKRTVVPMNLEEMVHPSQMIHQYTMFQRKSGSSLACFAVPMLPFFAYLSGELGAVAHATKALMSRPRVSIDLLGDGTVFNFTQLNILQVDWLLKQMVQALIALRHEPDVQIYEYGIALYKIIDVDEKLMWKGDFTDVQQRWIASSYKP